VGYRPPPSFTPPLFSTSISSSLHLSTLLSLHPPSHSDLRPLSLSGRSGLSTRLTSPPCLLPINFGADGGAPLSLCVSLTDRGRPSTSARRPGMCRSAPSLVPPSSCPLTLLFPLFYPCFIFPPPFLLLLFSQPRYLPVVMVVMYTGKNNTTTRATCRTPTTSSFYRSLCSMC